MTQLTDILRRADMEMLRGEWETAEPLYREARALAPSDPRAEMGLQNVRWMVDKAAEIEKRMAIAEALFSQSDYRGAAQEYTSIIAYAEDLPKVHKFYQLLDQKCSQTKDLLTWQERVQETLRDIQPLRTQKNWELVTEIVGEILQQIPQDAIYQPMQEALSQMYVEALAQEDQHTSIKRAFELLRTKDYESGIALLENIPQDSSEYTDAQQLLNQARSYLAVQKRDLAMVEGALVQNRWNDALGMLEQWRKCYQDTALWRQFYLQAGIAYGYTLLDHSRQLREQLDFDSAHRQVERAQTTFEKVLEIHPAHDLTEIAILQTQAQLDWDDGRRAEASQALIQVQQRLAFAKSEDSHYTIVAATVKSMLGKLQTEIERINEEKRYLHEAETRLTENRLGEAHRLFMATLNALLPEHQQQAAEGLRCVAAKIGQFDALKARGDLAEDPLAAVDAYQDAHDLWPESPDIPPRLEQALLKACKHELDVGRLAEAAGYGNRVLSLNPSNHEAISYIAKIGVKPQVEATLQRVHNEWTALHRQEILDPSAFDPLLQDLETVLRKVAEWPDLRADLESLHTTLRDARERRQQYAQYYGRAVQSRNRGAWTEALVALEQAVAALGDTIPSNLSQQLNVWRETATMLDRIRDKSKSVLKKASAIYVDTSKNNDLSAISEALDAVRQYLNPMCKLLESAAQQAAFADGPLPEDLEMLQKQAKDLDERAALAGDAIRIVSVYDALLYIQEIIRTRSSDLTLESIRAQFVERARASIGVVKQQIQTALQAGNLTEAEEILRQICELDPTDTENAQLYREICQRRALEEKLRAIEREAEGRLASGNAAGALKTWNQGLNTLLEPDVTLPKEVYTILNDLIALGNSDDGLALGQKEIWKIAEEQLAMLGRFRQENWTAGRAEFFADRWLRLVRDNALRRIITSEMHLGNFLKAYRAAETYFHVHPTEELASELLKKSIDAFITRLNAAASKRVHRAQKALKIGEYEDALQNLDEIETDIYSPVEQEFPDLLNGDHTYQVREQIRSLKMEVEKRQAICAEIEPHMAAARQAYLDRAWAEAQHILDMLPPLQSAPDLVEQVDALRQQISQAWIKDVRGHLYEVMSHIETNCYLATLPEQFDTYLQELRDLSARPDWQMLSDEDYNAYNRLVQQILQQGSDLREINVLEQQTKAYLSEQNYVDAFYTLEYAIRLTREANKRVALEMRRDKINPLAQVQQKREALIKQVTELVDKEEYKQARCVLEDVKKLDADITELSISARIENVQKSPILLNVTELSELYTNSMQKAQAIRMQWENPDYLRDKACDADLERIYELANSVLKIPGYENDKEAQELLSWVVQERSLYAQTRRFLKNAGFAVTAIENTLIYQVPVPSNLQDLLPATTYARVSLDKPLDSTQVLAIRDEVQKLDRKAQTVLVVTDQRPTNEGWAQIGTLGMNSFVILPLEQTLLRQGLLEGKEYDLLREELEKRLGMDYDPYDIRDPIAGAFSFFGRNKLAQDLLRRIGAGKPVGVFGLRKMGKSSLLRALSDRASFPIASMNLQGMVNADLNEIYEAILRQWRQWTCAHYNLGYDLPQFDSGDATSEFMSATSELLNRLETSIGEAHLGLFLDEAEVIVPPLNGSKPDLERYLALMGGIRELVDNDKRLSLVIASLNPSMSRINAWNGWQNPMFKRFQEVYLSPLAREDCIQMVRNLGRQVRQGGLDYTDASVEAIANLSGGHPFLARQFCSLLYQQRNCQSGKITVKAIPAAIEHFIYDEQTTTNLDAGIWQDAGNVALWGETQSQVNQAMLLDLAQANEPLIRESLLAAPDADARRTALINLERFHFIYQPEPGFYALQYGLLRIWLRRRRLGLESG